jgi:putative CocE/NonD family hydrolase
MNNLSQRILLERNVAVPMRDDTVLRADVWRPDRDESMPAILVRLPYGKDDDGQRHEAIDVIQAVEAGFAVVFQDTRGRFHSEGEFYPFIHEGQDGFDSVEWVARQPWCTGAVGTSGASYFGATQWLAAMHQPPHLKAIFPIITGSEYYDGWTYQGGAFQLGFMLYWTLLWLAPDTVQRLERDGRVEAGATVRLMLAADGIEDHYRRLPLTDQPALAANQATRYYFDWLAHTTDDDYWRAIAVNRNYNRVLVPAFNVGGWYDTFLGGTLENYTRMRQEGGSPEARAGQRLFVGPWVHGQELGVYRDANFGILASRAMSDLSDRQLAFFAHYLKGEERDLGAPVRLFVMGENRWRDEQEWPLARTRYVRWHLRGDGRAGSSGGWLSPEAPAEEPCDVYLYDPRDPCPTVGGPSLLPGAEISVNAGPRDQRSVEARPDVLVYTSAPLEQPLEVTGPLQVILYAATSAPDTDFVARLCDVCPDGTSRLLAEGILRARFREDCERERPITPGQVYEYHINLVATSNLFLPGHCIRVDVTSSSFPRFDANPNTGHAPGQDGLADVRWAVQTVFHTGQYPSYILLPVIPR